MRIGTPGFVPDRLKEAREARGISAISFAEMIGVSRAAVSQYENGKQSPSPRVLEKIATVLNVPIDRFILVSEDRKRGTIFYRSMASATKANRQRAESRYGWLREIVSYLRKFICMPKSNLPQFDVPKDPCAMTMIDIENLAKECRAYFKIGDGPISNVLWLLENNGAIVARHELFASGLDAFSEWRADDDNPFIILGSDKKSSVRSRFDIAHELGHLIIHRGIDTSSLNHPSLFKLIEQQANRFASSFLLPDSSFASSCPALTLNAFVSIKSKWKVSIGAMIMRSRQLNMISSAYERKLFMNLARRKWRTKEPLDDLIAPEEPRLLRQSFDILVNSGVIARHEIPPRIALFPADIESLAGLPPGYFDTEPLRPMLRPDAAVLDEEPPATIRFPGKVD